jgi:alpha-tubulin suppressor-like RCC1 family protein
MNRLYQGLIGIALITASCSGSNPGSGKGDAGMGDLSPTSTTVPDDHGRTRIATAVSSGDSSACAIVSGSVYCWGQITIDFDRPTPFRVEGLKSPATAIAVSGRSCAIVGGEVFCWTGTTAAAKVAGMPAGVTAIALGAGADCVLAQGRAYCWGSNNLGQLGNGTKTDSTTPVQVVGVPGEITALGVGEYFVCALASGDVYCWAITIKASWVTAPRSAAWRR